MKTGIITSIGESFFTELVHRYSVQSVFPFYSWLKSIPIVDSIESYLLTHVPDTDSRQIL